MLNEGSVSKLTVDEASRQLIGRKFELGINEMHEGKREIIFSGTYKPNTDEFCCIQNLALSDEIKAAVRDPFSVEFYSPVDNN